MNLFKRVSILIIFCSVFILGNKLAKEKVEGKAWVGVTYLMSERGASNGATAAVGAFGVVHSSMHSAIWGLAVGGPAGLIAGVAVGL